MANAWLAFIHHVAAFTMFAAVFHEHMTFKPDLTAAAARRLMRVDMVYGIAAVVVVSAGFFRAVHFEKSWVFYSDNLFFWIKLAAFLLAALLSIYPTMTFLSWRKSLRRDRLPAIDDSCFKRVTWLLRMEMLCLLVMLLAAALMARGIGLFDG